MKKIYLILIILTALLSLGILWSYLYISGNNPNINRNIADLNVKYSSINFNDLKTLNIENDIYNINFKLSDKLPTKATIYSYQKNVIPEPLVNGLNQNLNLTITNTSEDTSIGKFVLAGGNNTTISYYIDQGWIIYTSDNGLNTTTVNPLFNKDTNIDAYKSLAEQEYKKTFEQVPDAPKLDSLVYSTYILRKYPSPHYDKVDSREQAGLIEFIYEQNLEGLPIIDTVSVPVKNAVLISIAKDQTLKRVEIKLNGNVYENEGVVNLKSYDELVTAINNNEAALITGDFSEEDAIVNANLTRAEVSYLIRDSKTIPIYVLEGTIQSNTGLTSDVVWYINAVR